MFEPGEVSAGAPQLAGGRGTTELHRQQPQGDFPQGGRRGGGGKALRGEAGAGEEGGGGGEGGQKVARERWVAFAQSSLSRVSGEIKSDSVGNVSLLVASAWQCKLFLYIVVLYTNVTTQYVSYIVFIDCGQNLNLLKMFPQS